MCEVLLIYAYVSYISPVIRTKCVRDFSECQKKGAAAKSEHPLRNLEIRCESIGRKVDEGRQ